MARAYSNTNHRTIFNDGMDANSSTLSVDRQKTVYMIPKNFKGDRTVPLIIYCHGAGQDGYSPIDPAQFGQLGNITALAEAGWPILSCDWGGPETWARQNYPSSRQLGVSPQTTSGNSITVSLPAPAQAKNLIQARFLVSSNSPGTFSISPSTGWVFVGAIATNGATNRYVVVYEKLVSAGGEQTVTLSWTGTATFLSIGQIEEFYGWAGTPTRDYTNTQNSATGGSATFDTTAVGSLVLPAELQTAGFSYQQTISSLAGNWASSSGASETVNDTGVDLASSNLFPVGVVGGKVGTYWSWVTARFVAAVEATYYDKVTAPDSTNALTVKDYITDGITWAGTNIGAKTSKIGIFGTSMGGLNSLYYTAHNLSLVKCWAGIGPVNDLQDMVTNNRGGFAQRINNCYPGGYSDAIYGAYHNPTVMASNGVYGSLPMQIWYGSSDVIVVPSTVTNFQSLVGASCQINSMAGGHAESTWAEVDTDSLISFFLQNLGLT